MQPTNIIKIAETENSLVIELFSRHVDVNEVNIIINEYNIYHKHYKHNSLVIKPLAHTIFTSSARDLLAKFIKSIKLDSIAYVALNRYQVTNGSLLMSLCNRNLTSRVCFSVTDAIEWNRNKIAV